MDNVNIKPVSSGNTNSFVMFVFMFGPIIIISLNAACDVSAMEIKNGQLKIPTPEMTLIWEHYCMKHIAQNEFHFARLNKRAIEFQRANKLYWNSSPDQFAHFQAKLAEAQAAKDKAGGSWTCNPPNSKLAFVEIKVGQCGEVSFPGSFISTSGATVDTEGVVAILDSDCRSPEIKWIVSAPKYNVSRTMEMSLSSPVGGEEIGITGSGLSSDETSFACTVESSGSTKKMGAFTAVAGSFRCSNITYGVGQAKPVLIGRSLRNLAIPSAPRGDRGNDFKVDVEAKLFCDGSLSDNISAEIGQDERDQLRQEYLDMGKNTVPGREELVSKLQTGHFNLADFNSSLKAGGGKYGHILCRVLDRLETVWKEAGGVHIHINSGYRNPYKNGKTTGSGRESSHIYGFAADIGLADFNRDKKIDANDWRLMADLAKENSACVEPWHAQPINAVYGAPSWVHMDWRGACPSDW